MLENFLVGIAVLGVSGLCYLAYEHPEQYRTLYPFILVITGAIWIALSIWKVCLSVAEGAIVMALIEADANPSNLVVVDSATKHLDPSFATMVIIPIAVLALCFGLDQFVTKLKNRKPD